MYMENFNTVPDKGTFGGSVAVVNHNFLLAQQALEMLWQGEIDKPYDPSLHSGMGRKILSLKKDGSNVLTQADFDKTNTIYIIQYDFTLGKDITVPANCILEFDGGSISGVNNTYTLTGNNTLISYNFYNILKGVQVAGTFKNDSVVIDIFDDNDWSIKMAKSSIISHNIEMIASKTYMQLSTLTINFGYSTINGHYAIINSSVANSIIVTGNADNIEFKNFYFNSSDNTGTWLSINGTSESVSTQVRAFNISNCYVVGYNLGIKANYYRQSTINSCAIDCANGIYFSGKTAEIQIINSILYPSTTTVENSYGIKSYTDEEISTPYVEGITLIGTLVSHFNYCLDLNDIYGFIVTGCWLETGSINIKRHRFIKNIIITSCWINDCHLNIDFPDSGVTEGINNIILKSCIFENCTRIINITGVVNTVMVCDCKAYIKRGDYIAIVFNKHNGAHNVVFSNLIISGFNHCIVNNATTKIEGLQYRDIQFIDCGNNVYKYSFANNLYVRNCTYLEDTPILNEVRRIDGVAKYWDGSAWQAM